MTIDFSQIIGGLVPDVQIETDWTGGLNALPKDVKKLLLLGYKTSAGAVANGVVTRVTGRQKAMDDHGPGSQLACMAERAIAIAPRVPIFAVSFAEAAGGVQAFGTIVIAGPATGSGTLTVIIGGRRVVVGIAKDDAATAIGDALAAAINALTNAPFTAANVTGTVTVTARNKGVAGNSIRMYAKCTAAGVTATAAATLTSGATEGDPATVLAGIESERFHLIAMNSGDSTVAGVLKTDREKQSGVAVKKWGMGIVPHVGTEATGLTLAQAINSYRMQVIWQYKSQWPAFELAAAFGAMRALKKANVSLDDELVPGLEPPPAPDESAWPNPTELQVALEDGLTPIRSERDGFCEVVRSVVARTTSPVHIDHNPIEISDYADGYLIELLRARAKGRRLKVGSAPGTPSTITPSLVTAIINEGCYKLDKDDYIQGVAEAIAKGFHFSEVNGSDPNRMDSAWRFWPIAFDHFNAIKKTYVTSEG